ncbi:MAG: bifunctional proline dehydrogenase/L-glutamate gamma-semialdehyde dehydrogenase [Candidatus Omnitrophica bacterium]|nr:bifunctional proline dehydrogenase/L-glutamate gamma-semialdehyde dehydrogenase [Candidatus Omnitrophota bacterium]
MAAPLDERAIEERTQAIGRELFAAAKRESAHLSVLNRWTQQVLSWCLADPALKSSVLRFIDVLPSLKSPQAIARHVREYFPTTNLRLPTALRVGSALARSGLLTAPALGAVITQMVEQVARQFIAESQAEGARRIVTQLAARGAACSLDVLGEQVVSEAEADRHVQQCETLLDQLASAYTGLASPPLVCGPAANLSIKPSALTPRFDPISPAESIARALQRLAPLVQRASARGALVTLDMEQYALRDLTVSLAMELLSKSAAKSTRLGVVIQAYLRDAEMSVDRLLEWLAVHQCSLTVRLVKGAYWDHEVAYAAQRHWPIPVHEQKAETDRSFERLTARLLSAHPTVTTAIASHNIRSIAHAMAVAEALGLPKPQLEFQLLYGMGDAVGAAVTALGYPLRIYTPIGPLIPGMAYLVRRILENTANESFLRQEFLEERSAEELLKPPVLRADGVPRAEGRTPEWIGEPPLNFSNAAARTGMAQAVTSVRSALGRRYLPLLADEAVESVEPLIVRNPSNGEEVLGEVAMVSPAHLDRAVQLAHDAQREWATRPVGDRAACLRRAADLIRRRRYELAAWEILEVGKTWREADADLVETIDYLDYYSQRMLELADGRPLPQLPGERNRYQYVPRGVAVVIAPWNFPAAILMGTASAALVSGNAVLLKPAEQSSIIALLLTQILREAGIPPPILQCLPGVGSEVGASLVRHQRTHVTLFTGSKAVGLSIVSASAQVAADQPFVKHVIAEMGGKNALIIDEDADLDAAVQGTVISAFGYGGQKCSAASRLIVHQAVYDQFLERLAGATDRLVVGDPADPAVDLGPLIDESAERRLRDAIAHAHEVATVAYRYPPARLPQRGHFVGPVIVTDVPRRHPMATEELFGPLVCVFRAATFEEALALANASPYALTGGVYSRSPSHAARAVEAFDVGNLYINRPITGAVVGRQPFGGHRLSGLGTKAGGPDYLLQLLLPKTICEDTSRHGIPLD